jgi:hypothetical protein
LVIATASTRAPIRRRKTIHASNKVWTHETNAVSHDGMNPASIEYADDVAPRFIVAEGSLNAFREFLRRHSIVTMPPRPAETRGTDSERRFELHVVSQQNPEELAALVPRFEKELAAGPSAPPERVAPREKVAPPPSRKHAVPPAAAIPAEIVPTILCIATSPEQAERIVDRLRSEDIEEVFVMLQPTADSGVAPLPGLTQVNAPPTATSPATGALVGGAVGGFGALAGLAIPGFAPLFLVAAPFAAAAGAAIGAAAAAAGAAEAEKDHAPVADVRTVRDLGIPPELFSRYHQRLDAGDHLIAVHTLDEQKLARAGAIFAELEGEDINLLRETRKLFPTV